MVCEVQRHQHAGASVSAGAAASPLLWQRFATDIVWNVTGALFNQGSTLALGLVVANVLGREQYGVYGFLQSTILLFMNVGQMAMGVVATKFVGEYHIRDKERAGRVIALCLAFSIASAAVAATAAFLLAPAIAASIFHDVRAANLVRAGVPAIFFMIVAGPCSGILAGFGNFRKNALAGVAGGLVYFAVGAAAAVRFGLMAVIVGIGASSGFLFAVLLALVFGEARWQGVPVTWRQLRSIGSERRNLFDVAVPAALTGFSTLPAIWLATAILARQRGGMAALALFTAANSIRQVILYGPYLINNVGFSVLSRHRGTGDEAGFRRAFWLNVFISASVAVAMCAATVAGGPWILRVFGPAFAGGYGVLVLLAAAAIPEALALGIYQLIQSRGLIWMSFFFVALPRDGALVLFAFLLSPRHGPFGLAEAFMISVLIMLTSTLLLGRRHGIQPAVAPAPDTV